MKRVMLQTYVHDADTAITLYQKAFNAKLLEITRSPEGKVIHSELDIYGQILAVADRDEKDGKQDITGNIMQFCLHFEKDGGALVKQAYSVLHSGGTVLVPLGPCFYCTSMTDLIDPFGVRWCIFVD